MCTDGLANKGLGSLDGKQPFLQVVGFIGSLLLEMKTDEAFSSAQQFYKDLGDIAVEKGYEGILCMLLGVHCYILYFF